MGAAISAMRLVRDDEPEVSPAPDPLAQIDTLRRELSLLQSEMNHLLRKDESLHYHITRIDEELRLAARLQQDFLPKTLPQLGRVHFNTFFRPAGYVSGDFYDVMRLDEKHVGFYLADAVGHGVPAALLTMFIKHALVTKQIDPGGYRLLTANETMTRLNNMLVSQNLSAATFATALYGIINIETHQVSFARAGHPHPIVLRASGEMETIQSTGGLLGIFPDETFDDVTLQLQPGDRLILYTDGVEVAFSPATHIDTDRWHEALSERRHMGSRQLIDDLAQHLDRETGSINPKDDLTLLTLEVV